MMEPGELKPCPFCGEAVKLEKTITKGADGRDWWGVVCRSGKGLGGTCAIQQRPSASKEAAVTRWNTRSSDALEAALLRIDRQNDWLAEIQMNAHKWMTAHDRLKAGKPYDLPKPADLPECVSALRSALQRVDRNFDLLLAGKPVRDVAETKAEVSAVLSPLGGSNKETS